MTRLIALFALAFVSLAGCVSQEQKGNDELQQKIEHIKEAQAAAADEANKLYLPVKTVSRQEADQSRYLNMNVTMGLRGNLVKAAYEIEKQTGLRVNIAQDVFFDDESSQNSTTGNTNNVSQTPETPRLKVVHPASERKFTFNNNLDAVLNSIASDYLLSWELDAETKQINIFRYKTEIFPLALFGEATSTVSATMNAGSLSQTTQMQHKNSGLEGVIEIVEAMKSESGRVKVDNANRNLVVTDYPSNLSAIKKYVNEVLKKARSKVAIDLKVLNLSISDSENFSMNMDVLIKGIFDGNVQYKGVGSTLATSALNFTNKAGDITAIIQQFEEFGNVSTVFQEQIIGDNNQAIVVQDLKDNRYISSVSPQTYDQNGNTVPGAVNTDNVPTGVNLLAIPNIVSDNEVGLQLNFRLSAFIDKQKYPDTLVEDLITTEKTYNNRITLQPNKFYPLKIYEINKNTDKKGGTAGSPLLGGYTEKALSTDYWVVLVKVRVI
jgi:hypothetical protein